MQTKYKGFVIFFEFLLLDGLALGNFFQKKENISSTSHDEYPLIADK